MNRLLFTFAFFFFTLTSSRGELPSPRLDRINPLGTSAGSSVEIEIAGADLEEGTKLLFDHPGLKGEHLKERRFKITAEASVPPGTYDLFVLGRYGLSNPRIFVVSSGFTELMEKEPNDEPEQAQPVAVDSIVNGTTESNREDIYRVTLKKGQRLIAECQAGIYESLMDATMSLSDASGKQLASNGDYIGRDPLIDFVAPQDGDYLISVYDLSFRGGYPYRLLLSTKPHLENVFPRAVQLGVESKLTLLGRNFGSLGKSSTWKWNDLALEERMESYQPLPDLFQHGRYHFFEHPTHHSSAPTAATCTLTGAQFRGTFAKFQTSAVPLVYSDIPVTLETEPNDESAKPQAVTLPLMLSGRFDRDRDGDWFEFEAQEDGQHLFEVYCERIAGRADPYLVVYDDKNNRVIELDDFGHRIMAFDGHLRDPWGMVSLNKKKKYRVLVQDRYRRGGARYQYVLSIKKPTPDFFPAIIHHQNPGPGGMTLRKGGSTHVEVILHHKDGTNAPVTLTAEGLPKGVHASPTSIHSDTRGSIVLWADKDAADFAGPIRFVATSKRGATEIAREVRAYTRSWNDQGLNSSRPLRQPMLAVLETAPFFLAPAEEKLTIKAGEKKQVKVQLSRHWEDFKSSVNLIPHNFPGPIKMGNVTIREGKLEATVTIEVQANARSGDYTICLMGQAQVPFAKSGKEPKAGVGTKPYTLVSLPSRPITVQVEVGTKQ
jgi:hypothetical protein